MAGGRPKRDLPEGIGKFCDAAVAASERAKGRPITANGIAKLRQRRGIPPASERERLKLSERQSR